MIYTVFFTGKDSNKMPHDCETYGWTVEVIAHILKHIKEVKS